MITFSRLSVLLCRKSGIFLATFIFFMIPGHAEFITVAVAANVKFVFTDLQHSFKDISPISIRLVSGSSGKLSAQIEHGAPYDIFVSADLKYPEALYLKGFTLNSPQVYGYGKLVLWSRHTIKLDAGIQILTHPDIKKIAIPFPKTAPYGAQALRAIDTFDLYDRIEPKLVYGESIAQVNQFILSASADIGFTAKSVVLAPHLQDKGSWVELDPSAYQPIAQAAVILKHAEFNNLESVRQFYEFLYSARAREIFSRYGYSPP